MKKKLKIKILFISLILFNNSLTQEKSNQKKLAVFVVGTGRSGTSCASFILKTLGLEFGNNLTPTNPSNPKGNFEDANTRNLNKKILNELNVSSTTVRYINWNKNPQKNKFVNWIKKHLTMNFAYLDKFCIKNPQSSFLLPLYIEAATELGYYVKIIIITRNTQQTAKSFAGHFQGNPLKVYPLLCDCYKSILIYTQNQETIVIDYEEILYDTSNVVDKINTFIPSLKQYTEVSKEIENFLEPALQHYKKG